MANAIVAEMLSGPFAFVLLECVLIGLQVLLTGFGVGGKRKKYFTKAFFEKNFPELKGSVPQGGYPDCGSGKFSQKLSVAEWQDFNNAQRAHLNYVEGAATIIIALVVAGLFQPRLTAVLGAVYIVGRFLFALGYKSAGPKGRLVGVLLLDLALFSAIGVGAYCSFQAAGGVKGALDLVQHVVRLDLWQ